MYDDLYIIVVLAVSRVIGRYGDIAAARTNGAALNQAVHSGNLIYPLDTIGFVVPLTLTPERSFVI